jgi:hypothetical protein
MTRIEDYALSHVPLIMSAPQIHLGRPHRTDTDDHQPECVRRETRPKYMPTANADTRGFLTRWSPR